MVSPDIYRDVVYLLVRPVFMSSVAPCPEEVDERSRNSRSYTSGFCSLFSIIEVSF